MNYDYRRLCGKNDWLWFVFTMNGEKAYDLIKSKFHTHVDSGDKDQDGIESIIAKIVNVLGSKGVDHRVAIKTIINDEIENSSEFDEMIADMVESYEKLSINDDDPQHDNDDDPHHDNKEDIAKETLARLETFDFSPYELEYMSLSKDCSPYLGLSLTHQEFCFIYRFINNEHYQCWTLDEVRYDTQYASIRQTFNETPPFRARDMGSTIVDYDGTSTGCYLYAPDELIEFLTVVEAQFMTNCD